MATQEVIRDLPSRPLAPVDENVRVPDAVKRAGAAAEAIHAQTYQPEAPAPEPPADPPTPEPSPQPDPPAPEPSPQPDPPAEPPADAVPTGEEIKTDTWANRYNAMKGRFEQSQETVQNLQQMVTDLGDELMRTQQMIAQPRQPADLPQPGQPQPKKKLITDEDESTFGKDFIDLARRAGLEAVQDELGELRTQQVDLQKRLRSATRQTIGQYLDSAVPDWKRVMASPRFKAWLRLPDVYSSRVRKGLLDSAYQAADAPRVAMFFKGFLAEERAAGRIADPVPPTPEPPAPAPVPREPAVPLATLAAPGRATRPATGTQQPDTPADKPIFTRKQIADFYASVRQGRWNGRETEKAQYENQIFAAQREGRVR